METSPFLVWLKRKGFALRKKIKIFRQVSLLPFFTVVKYNYQKEKEGLYGSRDRRFKNGE